MTTTVHAPELPVASTLILNRLARYHGKTGCIILIDGRGHTTGMSGTASVAYGDLVRYLQDYREQDPDVARAWEAWRDNEIRFKF